MLETSIYTYIFKNNGKYYLFNTQNCFFAEISEELYTLIYNRDYSKLDDGMISSFLEKGILICSESKYDYFNDQKIRFLSNSFDNKKLCLVIAPNSGCNFECPYCFEEKKRQVSMKKGFDEAISKFINEHNHAETLSLVWYGGEPLLSFPRIKEIYYRIINETRIKIVSHSIITNGYLINDCVIDFFKQSNLDKIQITLDGKEKTHNLTRYLKLDKKPTFKTIIDNIVKVARNMPNCKVSVRINVSKSNSEEYISLCRYLTSFGLKNIQPYPGFIRKDTPDKRSFCCDCLDNESAAEFLSSVNDRGLYISKPGPALKGCMVNHINSYIIGPEGELYKCWNDFNNSNKVIGNICSNEIVNKHLLHSYLTELSAFSDDKCKDCMFFPICSGGCSWYRYRNKYEKGKFNLCYEFKNLKLFEQYLLDTYLK